MCEGGRGTPPPRVFRQIRRQIPRHIPDGKGGHRTGLTLFYKGGEAGATKRSEKICNKPFDRLERPAYNPGLATVRGQRNGPAAVAKAWGNPPGERSLTS